MDRVPQRASVLLYVGTTVGAKDVVNTGETASSSFLATNVPTGQTLFARIWTKAGGVWRYSDSTFSAAPHVPSTVTIEFNGLTSNDAPVTIYAEAGFTFSADSANWVGWASYGHPAPFIEFKTAAHTTTNGTLQVVAAGHAAFTFTSVDVYSSVTSIPITINGLRNSRVVFTQTTTVPNTWGEFATVINAGPTTIVDTLIISLTNGFETLCCGNPMGVDNVVLTR